MPGFYCNWIEIGYYIGPDNCGGYRSTPTFFIEYVRNLSTSTFKSQTCLSPNHWQDAAKSQDFYLFDSVPYGTDHAFELRYVPGA